MKPEMQVRAIVRALGYRYRLHRKTLPGHPDIIFPSLKKAIFVNGCFWHQHCSTRCKIQRVPKSNLEYWLPKLERNRLRDIQNHKALRRLGWRVMTVWECEIRNVLTTERKLQVFLESQ